MIIELGGKTMTPEQAKAASDKLRQYSNTVDAMIDLLDNTSAPCSCCGTEKWNDWQQHQLAERLIGITEKMDNAAAVFARFANNPNLLDEGKAS
jgi:hypothetical protein